MTWSSARPRCHPRPFRRSLVRRKRGQEEDHGAVHVNHCYCTRTALAFLLSQRASPGAIKISSTRGDCSSFQAKACSLPPPPTMSTRRGVALLLTLRDDADAISLSMHAVLVLVLQRERNRQKSRGGRARARCGQGEGELDRTTDETGELLSGRAIETKEPWRPRSWLEALLWCIAVYKKRRKGYADYVCMVAIDLRLFVCRENRRRGRKGAIPPIHRVSWRGASTVVDQPEQQPRLHAPAQGEKGWRKESMSIAGVTLQLRCPCCPLRRRRHQ